MRVKYGNVFIITKGNRTARWKVIDHPWLCAYGLVRDYHGMYGNMNSTYHKEDADHIVAAVTLENAYNVAYDLT